jgi:hypothetical protein
MPTRRPPERPAPSKLTKPLVEARATIDGRIADGEKILQSLRPGPLSEEARAWDDKNETLLERLFTGHDEYNSYRGCVLSNISLVLGEPRASPHRTRESPALRGQVHADPGANRRAQRRR